MPEAINRKILVERVPELKNFPDLVDPLASLANTTGEASLGLGRLGLTFEQSEEVNRIINRALGQAAILGVELGQKTKQPLELDGLIALNMLMGATIEIGRENVTRPQTPESAGLPQPDLQR